MIRARRTESAIERWENEGGAPAPPSVDAQNARAVQPGRELVTGDTRARDTRENAGVVRSIRSKSSVSKMSSK